MSRPSFSGSAGHTRWRRPWPRTRSTSGCLPARTRTVPEAQGPAMRRTAGPGPKPPTETHRQIRVGEYHLVIQALKSYGIATVVGTRTWGGTRSAGPATEELLDTPALPLGRTARAAVPGSHRDSLLAGWRGRAVVDVARGGSRCADTLGDDLLDDHDAFTFPAAQPHLVTGPYGMRGLDPDPVDPDVPGPAGTGRGRTGRGQPHRPDPAVHPPGLITCHSPNCNAIRAHRLRPA
jgi:hypothetical protein